MLLHWKPILLLYLLLGACAAPFRADYHYQALGDYRSGRSFSNNQDIMNGKTQMRES